MLMLPANISVPAFVVRLLFSHDSDPVYFLPLLVYAEYATASKPKLASAAAQTIPFLAL